MVDLVSLMESLNEYGPAGLFVIAFISNLIPGFPAIYLTFIGTYAAVVDDPTSSIMAVVLSGLGAGLGKVVVFLSSRALGGMSERVRRKREETRWLIDEAGRGIFFLVFLFAALPLPDDVLYIPLGLTGYRLYSFAVAVIAGKIAQTGMIYILGRAYRSAFEKIIAGEAPQENLSLFMGGIFVGTIVVTLIIFTMDWQMIYRAYKDRGVLNGIKYFIIEVFRALIFILTLGRVGRR